MLWATNVGTALCKCHNYDYYEYLGIWVWFSQRTLKTWYPSRIIEENVSVLCHLKKGGSTFTESRPVIRKVIDSILLTRYRWCILLVRMSSLYCVSCLLQGWKLGSCHLWSMQPRPVQTTLSTRLSSGQDSRSGHCCRRQLLQVYL